MSPEAPVQDEATASCGRDEAALLRELLASRDMACPVCSYNLRGLDRPVCPECAAPLRLELGSSRLAIGAWLLAVLSLALALGFDAVVAVLLTVGLIAFPPKSPAEQEIVLAILGCFLALSVGAGVGIGVLVRRRTAWNRMPPMRRWTIAAAIFIAMGVGHGIFGLIVSRYVT